MYVYIFIYFPPLGLFAVFLFVQAGANVEQLMKDPKMMAEAQRQMQAMMGGAAA